MDKEEYDWKSTTVFEIVQQNINDADFVQMMYEFFFGVGEE